jgi:hypothetical protein
MLWFGSSAGVAVTNEYPEARSAWRWVKEAWWLPIAFAVGFAVQMAVFGWVPSGSD